MGAGGQHAEAAPRLELVGIEKNFGAIEVLRGADLTAHGGEIVGLCGDVGAGKSTLVKILAGVHAHGSYRGQIRLAGKEQRLGSPAAARRAGIAVVHAQSMLVPQLSVAHNLLLGDEPRRFGLVDEECLQSQARHLLARFGFDGDLDPSTPVGELAQGWRLIVEVLRALARTPHILVLDEPSALLLPHERERLLSWLGALRSAGTTCLYVAHRLDEVMGLCDHITLLRNGRTAHTVGGTPRRALGRYLVHDEIASGGMATVHLGAMRGPFGFTSTVAIKRLQPALAKDPEFVAMFLDEARLASRVRHPNVVPVLDVLADEGDLGLVMEYVAGESLSRLVRGEVPIAIAIAIASSILHGLQAAHEARDEQGAPLGLVHRDVSPQNVLVGEDGVARLIDFGVAKAAGRRNASRTGQLKGKIAYMAPEQIQRGNVTARTDVYGAAVVLWELLTGERLFDGDTEGMVLGRVLDDVVPPPSSLRAGVSRELDAIVLRGLDRVADRRFASARDMARALEAIERPATAEEIGDWVRALAGPSLATRREALARLEREAHADASPTATPAAIAPRPPARRGPIEWLRAAFRG